MKTRRRFIRIFKDQKPPKTKKKKKTKKVPHNVTFSIDGAEVIPVVDVKFEKIQTSAPGPIQQGSPVSIDSNGKAKAAELNESIIGFVTAVDHEKGTVIINKLSTGGIFELPLGKQHNPMGAFDKSYPHEKGSHDLYRAVRGWDGGEPLRKIGGVIKAPKELMDKAMAWAEKNASTTTEKDIIRASNIHAILLNGTLKHYGRVVVSQLNKITNPAKCFTRALAFQVRHLKFATYLFRNKGALLLWQQGIISV